MLRDLTAAALTLSLCQAYGVKDYQLAGAPTGAPLSPPIDANGPSLFTALAEQLGLKLEPEKGPVEIMVIDHVERPSEN